MTERRHIATSLLPVPGSAPVEWRVEPGLTAYAEAIAVMEARAAANTLIMGPDNAWPMSCST